MNIPNDLQYTKSHEWVRIENETATVGITDYAQEQLTDITFVELPAPGARLERGGEAAVIESVKAAADIYTPLSGEVLEVNGALEDRPEEVNGSPYREGWLYRVKPDDPEEMEELLTADQYRALLSGDGA